MGHVSSRGSSGYSPAHITAFFMIHQGNTPAETGSTGAGICLEGGVSTSVVVEPSERMELRIFAGGTRFTSPTCLSLFNILTAGRGPFLVTAYQESLYPANFGYGISAASALSLGLALNGAMGLGLSREEVGVAAHIAEVENMTGLGDVSAELVGGVELREKAGAPGIGRAVRLSTGEGMAVVSSPVRAFPTRTMITGKEHVERINLYGREAVESFAQDANLKRLMAISRRFWESVGLIDGRVRGVLRRFEGAGVQDPSAKKGVVFGVVPADEAPRVASAIVGNGQKVEGSLPFRLHDKGSGIMVFASKISSGGAS